MKTGVQCDVFLGHSRADKPAVRRLTEQLRAAGLRVWIDGWIIQSGDEETPWPTLLVDKSEKITVMTVSTDQAPEIKLEREKIRVGVRAVSCGGQRIVLGGAS